MAKKFIDSANHHMLRNLRRHIDLTKEFIETIEKERKIMNSANTVQEVMGAEGRARKTYYEAFNTFVKENFKIEKREKRPPKDPMNALISFGNAGLLGRSLLG